MKFDPQTGEPIAEAAGQVVEQVGKAVKKSFFKTPLFFGLAGGVAVAATAATLVFTGTFLSGRDKVTQAIVNTVKDSGELTKTMQAFQPEDMKEFTMAIGMEVQGVEFEAEYRHTPTDKQVWVAVEQQMQMEATATITKDKVLASSPLLDGTLLVYDYTQMPTGFLLEAADYNYDAFTAMNEAFAMIYEIGSEDVELSDDTIKEIKKWYKSIEVEKEDEKESFEINGKDKDCVGYTLEVDEEFVEELVEIMVLIMEDMEVYDEEYIDDMKESALDSIDGMESVDMTFYLDSKKLAAIVLENDGEEIIVAFEGGKYRMQNINIEYDGITVAKIKGETDGKEETAELVVNGETMLEYTYDAKSGELEMIIYEYGEEIGSLECVLNVGKDAISLSDATLEIITADYYYDSEPFVTSVDFSISLTRGASIEKLTGTEFNLSTAGAAEFEEFYEQFEGLFW